MPSYICKRYVGKIDFQNFRLFAWYTFSQRIEREYMGKFQLHLIRNVNLFPFRKEIDLDVLCVKYQMKKKTMGCQMPHFGNFFV